jgi:hypothetical protein
MIMSSDPNKMNYEPSPEIETPKYSYQDIDSRTYSVDCCGSSDRYAPAQDEQGQIFSLKNLSGLQ